MSTKPLWYRWARVYFAGSCIIGTGVLCYIYTTPTDEQLIASFSPEIRDDYERNRAVRQREQEELMEIVKKTSQSNDPVWKTGPIGSPFEKEQRNLNQQLIDYNQFEKKMAEDYQREQLNKAQQELLEVEKLAAQTKKGYWWNPFSSK